MRLKRKKPRKELSRLLRENNRKIKRVRETDRERQTDRQADRQTERHIERHTERHTDRKTERQRDRGREIERKSVKKAQTRIKEKDVKVRNIRETREKKRHGKQTDSKYINKWKGQTTTIFTIFLPVFPFCSKDTKPHQLTLYTV